MVIHNQIRFMREAKQWSQEDMAEKLDMSVSGYAKIERGETKLDINRLQKIAHIFDMDILEFMQQAEKGVVFLMSDNGDNANYQATYYGEQALGQEIDKLKIIIDHKEELIQQKEYIIRQQLNELEVLRKLVNVLENQKG